MGQHSFGERWRVPGVDQLRRDWLQNLEIVDEPCTCPGRYHRVWGGLKIAGRHTALYRHAECIGEVLRPMLAHPRRILIAGSADDLILRLLADIGSHGGPHQFRLIDRCPAPLALAEDVALRKGWQLETQCHALGTPIATSQPFDLIFGHYVLNFLDRDQLAATFRTFGQVLSPEGKVVIVHRTVRDGTVPHSGGEWISQIGQALDRELAADDPVRARLNRMLADYGEKGRGRPPAMTTSHFEDAIGESGLKIVSQCPADGVDRDSTSSSVTGKIEPRLYVISHG